MDVRLLRPADLLDARLSAFDCTIDSDDGGGGDGGGGHDGGGHDGGGGNGGGGDGGGAGSAGGAVLVAHGEEAYLVLHLPPQHLGEQTWPDPGQGPPAAHGQSAHRAAAATRLVFPLPDGARVRLTLDDILALLPDLQLRVAPHATPAGEDALRDVPPAWLRPVLGSAPASVLDRAGSAPLAELISGDGRDAGLAATEPGDRTAAAVLHHAAAVRLVRGHAGRGPLGLAPGSRLGEVLSRLDPARHLGPAHSSADPTSHLGRANSPADPTSHLGPVGPLAADPPRPPTDAETAIEAPYRLTVSPSVLGAFHHETSPLSADGDPSRIELWRTHLTVRAVTDEGRFAGAEDAEDPQRIVRAVWSRDLDPLDAGAMRDPDPFAHDPQPLVPPYRRSIVRQTSDARLPAPPRPLRVRSFALSSLGAWIDWAGAWDPSEVAPGSGDLTPPIESYRHQAVMGRDSYVRVTQPGFLFPFGHRAVWVTVSERKVLDRADGVAYLWRRQFIIVREPTRAYAGHDTPLGQVTLEPLVTPNLDLLPGPPSAPFVPTQQGAPYAFSLVSVDQGGDPVTFAAPLVFVPYGGQFNPGLEAAARAAYAPVQVIPGDGRSLTVAKSVTPGDTTLEVAALVFTGSIDAEQRTSRPSLVRTSAVVPGMRHLAPHAAPVPLVYAPQFLAADGSGFGAGNPGQVFLSLAGTAPMVDFSGGSERSGGLLTPNFAVRGLSRTLGAVGEDGTAPDSGLASGEFNPTRFLEGALPKLFGLFSLLDLLETAHIPMNRAPAFVTEALDTVSAIVSEAQRLRAAAGQVGGRLDAEAAQAAHEGAKAGVEAAKATLEAVLTPLDAALETVLGRVAALPGAPDPAAAVTAVTDALAVLATRVDALLAQLGAPQLPAALRALLERPARALAELARAADTGKALTDFVSDLLSPGSAVTARLTWTPEIHEWPVGAPVFVPRDRKGLRLAVEVRASATTPPSVDAAAELVDFALELLHDEPLMALAFQRIGFRASSGAKPEVDVVFGGIEFLGPLAFIDTLRRMIPFDGFADPPFVDVSPEGVTAGFDLALPNVSVGVFSLENIALGADARVPFLGDAVTVGFGFCSKESPFRMTVMMVGGGGWVGLRASPKGLVLLEMGLEAAASLSVDLGVASGSVSVAVGVYLRLEGKKGSLTAYFRIRGEVDVLGLVSASITLELSLEYRFDSGKLVGRASLVVEVEVLFFSASVEITVERQLAGSKGDPVLGDVLPPGPDGSNADWSAYCEAFAPAA